jgi:hypothetical protein
MNNSTSLIHQLANLILLNGWSIFGGYVRDMLAGNEPHDLDIFATAADIPKLLSMVVSDRYRMTRIRQSTYHPNGWKVEIEELGEESNILNLDIVNPGISHRPDVDINRLVLSADGIRVMGGYQRQKHYDFSTIHQHIKERVFVPEFACSARRKAKLVTFGWTTMR